MNKKDEYIIINRTALEKKIEELEKESISFIPSHEATVCYKKLEELKQILSQSTPLIPELQKTWNEAYIDALNLDEEGYKPLFFEEYISNLKLNI